MTDLDDAMRRWGLPSSTPGTDDGAGEAAEVAGADADHDQASAPSWQGQLRRWDGDDAFVNADADVFADVLGDSDVAEEEPAEDEAAVYPESVPAAAGDDDARAPEWLDEPVGGFEAPSAFRAPERRWAGGDGGIDDTDVYDDYDGDFDDDVAYPPRRRGLRGRPRRLGQRSWVRPTAVVAGVAVVVCGAAAAVLAFGGPDEVPPAQDHRAELVAGAASAEAPAVSPGPCEGMPAPDRTTFAATITAFNTAYYAADVEALLETVADDSYLADQEWSELLAKTKGSRWCVTFGEETQKTADATVVVTSPDGARSQFEQRFTFASVGDGTFVVTQIDNRKGS
ncbi:MAG: hypothetical protein Q4B12_06610 [Bowdeniella nasicola]|nr:hypothetical protein [Bowdeniella nasicola]